MRNRGVVCLRLLATQPVENKNVKGRWGDYGRAILPSDAVLRLKMYPGGDEIPFDLGVHFWLVLSLRLEKSRRRQHYADCKIIDYCKIILGAAKHKFEVCASTNSPLHTLFD